jgi:secondary thiamine-phosphate synthase enzyme
VRQAQAEIVVTTRGRGLVDVTGEVARWLAGTGLADGLLTVFIRHTSASLIVQENAAPEVRTDLEAFLARLVPEGPGIWAHDDEGPDDMPAHVRAALTQTHVAIPFARGRLALGTWQGLYVWEHRRRGHARRLALHALGD